MTGAERGFLLLCSHLGNPERRPLTTAQFRTLAQRVRAADAPREFRDLEPRDIVALGYGSEDARRITQLLDETFLLDHYLEKGARKDCYPLTPISRDYPSFLRNRLGDDAPGCLWYKGTIKLLEQPAMALVGSRDLLPKNQEFARQAGLQAAKHGFALVSGNARGADRTAQDACLAAGGQVISVIADDLERHTPTDCQLFLSEDGFDTEFTKFRALSRNRIIHSLGRCTLVAQARLEKGGTWDGTAKNLRYGWSPVFCFDDSSESSRQLEQLGATLIGMKDLEDPSSLSTSVILI